MGSEMAVWEPFEFDGRPVMSFQGLDRALDQPKGSAFRAFKACRASLMEDRDFVRLDATDDGPVIERLKAQGRVYQTSVHVVLLTASGFDKVYGAPYA